MNLIELMPKLAALRLYDNSTEAAPAKGQTPALSLVLHMDSGRIAGPPNLRGTPPWAKAIVAQGMRAARPPVG